MILEDLEDAKETAGGGEVSSNLGVSGNDKSWQCHGGKQNPRPDSQSNHPNSTPCL